VKSNDQYIKLVLLKNTCSAIMIIVRGKSEANGPTLTWALNLFVT